MVVQCGLMFENEILAVENPEVHLHPGLQLKLTEFLLRQTRDNKIIMLETHSDLVIRRALRAILAEELPQEQVRIYFTDIEKAEAGYHYSTLQPLRVNEAGRIDNWPPGFMDDDLREASRLMDIMYGKPTDDIADEGDEEGKTQ